MRLLAMMTTLSIVSVMLTGCSKRMDDAGLAFAGETTADHVRLLIDETWLNAAGQRQVDQAIFDSVFEIIDDAEDFILMDFFLVNDFLYQPSSCLRPLSQELTDRLIAKRKADPEVKIIFITDPINTVYGSVESPHFVALQEAGVEVVWTDLNRLRDSNPLYSKPWRLLAKPWGTGPGDSAKNPIGEGRISTRSLLKLLNFKANHRKIVVSEKSLLVTSANPHSASSAHWNAALRIDGAGIEMACKAESAILRMSGSDAFMPETAERASAPSLTTNDNHSSGRYKLELLTEGKIKNRVLELMNGTTEGDRINLAMFYFSDRDVIKALISAGKRGCEIRVILDPNKDAFGRTKNGIPNRQTAARLVKSGVSMRWADTHGEQFHVKMLHVEHADGTAALLLGSCNFTRRNMDDFNAECDVVVTALSGETAMVDAGEVFDRWWTNGSDRIYTTDYAAYEDPSLRRMIRAWLMETTGLCSF